jgi:hypothetical protein
MGLLCFCVVFQSSETRWFLFLNSSEMRGLEALFWREVAGLDEQGHSYCLPFVEVEKGA